MRIRPIVVVIVLGLCTALPAAAQTIADLNSKTFAGVKGLVIPPTPRTDAGKLIDAGTLDVEGFGYITMNLAGEMKGPGTGDVGAILVPNVSPFDIVFQQLGLVPVSIEIGVRLPAVGSYFMAKQMRYEAGFPQYRVFFYNTSQATVQVAFFVRKTVN